MATTLLARVKDGGPIMALYDCSLNEAVKFFSDFILTMVALVLHGN